MDAPQYGVGLARGKSSAEPSSPPTEEQVRTLAAALNRVLPRLMRLEEAIAIGWKRQLHADVKRRNVLDLDAHRARREAAAAVRLDAFRRTPKPILTPALPLLVAVPNGPNGSPLARTIYAPGLEVAA